MEVDDSYCVWVKSTVAGHHTSKFLQEATLPSFVSDYPKSLGTELDSAFGTALEYASGHGQAQDFTVAEDLLVDFSLRTRQSY